MILQSHYVLAVPNLETSAAFYRDVLGFEIRQMGDDGWRMFVKDGCQIMAGHCPDAPPPRTIGDHSYFAYLMVDDVDTYYSRCALAGAEITKPLRDQPWKMREFGLRTIDGHRMMIGERITE